MTSASGQVSRRTYGPHRMLIIGSRGGLRFRTRHRMTDYGVVVESVKVSALVYVPVRSASLALTSWLNSSVTASLEIGRGVRQQVQRRGRGTDVVERGAGVGGVAGAGLERLRQDERAVDQVAGARWSSGRRRSAARHRPSRSRWPWSTPVYVRATPGVNAPNCAGAPSVSDSVAPAPSRRRRRASSTRGSNSSDFTADDVALEVVRDPLQRGAGGRSSGSGSARARGGFHSVEAVVGVEPSVV